VTRLGLLLATAHDVVHIAGLARAARQRGIEVRLFAMHDGVGALVGQPAITIELLDRGCHIVMCATSANRDGVELEPTLAGIDLGSQDDHAALIVWADRVVAFA
jgi:sulfur relay (sulfurtransferase) complex TusBCD TusD component (DsrE family)